MKKGLIVGIVLITILLFGIGVGVGVYLYQKEKVQDSNMLTRELAQQGEDLEEEDDIISASVTECKLSPNCTIVEKKYYKGCDHIIKDIKEIPEEWINWDEEKIKEQYSNWKLEDFSTNQIIVSQENEGYCPQHYILRENEGVIGIYTLDENGNETLKENTEIATKYLQEEDLESLEKGIKAIGDDQLYVVLSDFE